MNTLTFSFSVFVINLLCCESAFSNNDHNTLIRNKRDTRECKDKFKVMGTHSACKPRSSSFLWGGVTSAEIDLILQEHNQYRSNVTPPATDMLKMTWDAEVALVAQTWVEACTFEHDLNENRNIPGRFSLGQNKGKGYTDWSKLIQDWWSEVKDFTYNRTNEFRKVGHYTQLVWSTSNKIGCGMAMCGKYAFHVCNYAPAGNIGGVDTPYKTGSTACSDCPSNCKNKLCDCGQKACENGGEMQVNTCTCTCKHPSFQIGDSCKLDCNNLTEPQKCGGPSWDAKGCIQYSSVVPNECPKTCSVCPYGGYNYQEQGIKTGENGSMTLMYTPTILFLAVIVSKML